MKAQLAANASQQHGPVAPPAGSLRLEGEQALQRRGVVRQREGALQLLQQLTLHGEGG